MPKKHTEIRVGQKTNPNNLASSILLAWGDDPAQRKEVVICAIGPVPISQAYKAVAIANRALASRGVILVIIPGLVMKQMPDRANPKQTVPWVVAKMRLWDMFQPPPTSGDDDDDESDVHVQTVTVDG